MSWDVSIMYCFCHGVWTRTIVSGYCFMSLFVLWGNIATQGIPKPGLCPTLINNDFMVFFIVHSTIDSTIHFMSLKSFEHCICTATMTNIRPNRDSNLVPPCCKPQSIWMSYRGRPSCWVSRQHFTLVTLWAQKRLWLTYSRLWLTSCQHIFHLL